MVVRRAGLNLTKMVDSELNLVIGNCVNAGVDLDRIENIVKGGFTSSGRLMVRRAAVAITELQTQLIKTHRQAPSPESMLWSNLEGGHTYHELPTDEFVQEIILNKGVR